MRDCNEWEHAQRQRKLSASRDGPSRGKNELAPCGRSVLLVRASSRLAAHHSYKPSSFFGIAPFRPARLARARSSQMHQHVTATVALAAAPARASAMRGRSVESRRCPPPAGRFSARLSRGTAQGGWRKKRVSQSPAVCGASNSPGDESDGSDRSNMSESELMREMFRLEKLLQEGGPTTASSNKQPGDGLREQIQAAVSGATARPRRPAGSRARGISLYFEKLCCHHLAFIP